jgi:hypothetical protein
MKPTPLSRHHSSSWARGSGQIRSPSVIREGPSSANLGPAQWVLEVELKRLAAASDHRPCQGLRMPAVSTATTRSVGRRRQTYNARSRGRQSTGGAAGSMAI